MALSLGSELAIGIIFFGWLTGISAGSLSAGFALRFKKTRHLFITLALSSMCISLAFSIVLSRTLKTWCGYSIGEVVPFESLLWMIPLCAFPVSYFVGFIFPMFCSIAKNTNENQTITNNTTPSKIFGIESLGSVVGSLAFTFVAVLLFKPLTITFVIAALTSAAAYFWNKEKYRFTYLISTILFTFLTIFAAEPLENWTRKIQWNGEKIVSIDQSPYGNIVATRQSGQINLYSNGILYGVIPETVGSAFRAHIPLLLHPDPKTILVAGGSVSLIREILKHNPESVTNVELDPVMLSLRNRHMSNSDWQLMSDKRVRVDITDARTFINFDKTKYDVILVYMSDPETLLANRYYTKEFYQKVKNRLAPDGIFAFNVTFQEISSSAWQTDLLGTHLKTLTAIFQQPLLVTGRNDSLLITKRGTAIKYDPGSAIKHYQSRGIESNNFNPSSILESLNENTVSESLKQPRLIGSRDMEGLLEYDLTEDRIGYVFKQLKARPGSQLNTDLQPVSTYYQTRVSASLFKGRVKNLFSKISKKNLNKYWGILLVFLCFMFFVTRHFSNGNDDYSFIPAVAAAGFVGLCLEIVLLFVYQVYHGAMYYFVGLVLAAFMAGGWLGCVISANIISSSSRIREYLIAAMIIMMGILAWLAYGTNIQQLLEFTGGGLLFTLCCALATGGFTGFCFSIAASQIRHIGLLYAADHAGAAFGAVITSVLFIPLAGISGTLWICTITIFTALLCLIMPNKKLHN